MKDLFDMIVESPVRAFAFLLMLACVALLEVLRRSFFKRLNDNENKMQVFERSLGVHLKETRKSLATHSEDLGKATKAVNGDMLRIQKETSDLKTDLINRTIELEKYARELEHKTVALAHVFENTVERFDLKLAHVLNLRKELAAMHGQVQNLQEQTGQFRILHGKIEERIGNVGRVLKKHDDDLRTLKPKDPK